MIDWLQSGDDALFRLINHTLSNGVFDKIMPLARKCKAAKKISAEEYATIKGHVDAADA